VTIDVSEPELLTDPIEEGQRVLDEGEKRDLTVRLIGGTAIYQHSEAARNEFKRDYRDVDFVGYRSEEDELVELMKDLGYKSKERFNTMRRFRLEFLDSVNERKADYILDRFDFCHQWDLSDRLEKDAPTIPIEDLLLSKLQIFEPSDRDVRDILAMLTDHPVEAGDDTETIDPTYVSELTSSDWGLYKTVTMSLDRVEEHVENNDLPVEEEPIEGRVGKLQDAIEERPKSLRWKLRSIIGERKKWYKQPELG
jgi:hypothetical protein